MKVQAVKELRIADVAKDTGLTFRAIRLYEEKGLVTPGRLLGRVRGNTRIYSPEDLDRIHAIILASKMGFSLRDTALLIKDGAIVGRDIHLRTQERLDAIEMQKRTIEHAQAAIKLLEGA